MNEFDNIQLIKWSLLYTAARMKLGLATGEELVAAATTALAQGANSTSLAILAGEISPIYSDVEPQFQKGLKEIGLEFPAQQEAVWMLLQNYLADIVESRIDPYDGMRRIDKEIYRNLSSEMKNGKFLGDSLGIEFCYTWYRELQDAQDGSTLFYYHDLPVAEAVVKFKAHLIEEARNALKKIPQKQAGPK